MNGTCNNDTSTIHNNNNNFLKSLLHNLSKEQQTHNNTTNRQQHKTKSQHTYHRRPLKPPQAPTPAYNESMDELSLLRMSTSDPDLDLQHQQQVDKIVAVVKVVVVVNLSRLLLLLSCLLAVVKLVLIVFVNTVAAIELWTQYLLHSSTIQQFCFLYIFYFL